jgi:hypothetical protein
MHYRLRTLLIVLALGPVVLAIGYDYGTITYIGGVMMARKP